MERTVTAFEVMWNSSFSVYNVIKELDGKVVKFLSKRIEQVVPYLLIDAIHFKARDGLYYENKARSIPATIKRALFS